MTEEHQLLIRRLQYRVQRQGMLELDAWLAPLQQALQQGDVNVAQAIEQLCRCEAPDLIAMQAGSIAIPEELLPWLKV